jgi:ADP-heptose:LPS heptosyltransferase
MTANARPALQIYDARERLLVRAADVLLSPIGWLTSANLDRPVQRILLLRLERIGDLLMVIDAIRDVRATWPDASIDLAVAAWNEPIAKLLPGVSQVLTASPPWLARAEPHDSWAVLFSKARAWRRTRYDLVLNFEADLRSNWLAWVSGGARRVGYSSGGGGAFLTSAGIYDPSAHVSINARRLVERAAGESYRQSGDAGTSAGARRLDVPDAAASRASDLLANARTPLVGVHASGGRLSKQWHLDRFALVARTVAARHGATIVLTGSASDRPMVDNLVGQLRGLPVIDAAGTLDLPTLAALLSRLDVFLTGDTGPMHLAAVMGAPVVALFGPSAPERYGPLGSRHRVIRVDLPCSPCGRVRLPPERCQGHVPDCMDGIQVEMVTAAVSQLLAEWAPRQR